MQTRGAGRCHLPIHTPPPLFPDRAWKFFRWGLLRIPIAMIYVSARGKSMVH